MDSGEERGRLFDDSPGKRRSDREQHGLPRDCRWEASGTATIWTRGSRMHFEILVEDSSGKKALDILMPKILGDQHTFRTCLKNR